MQRFTTPVRRRLRLFLSQPVFDPLEEHETFNPLEPLQIFGETVSFSAASILPAAGADAALNGLRTSAVSWPEEEAACAA